jgi:hypothetical protein
MCAPAPERIVITAEARFVTEHADVITLYVPKLIVWKNTLQ